MVRERRPFPFLLRYVRAAIVPCGKLKDLEHKESSGPPHWGALDLFSQRGRRDVVRIWPAPICDV